jgi:hypothetical protein
MTLTYFLFVSLSHFLSIFLSLFPSLSLSLASGSYLTPSLRGLCWRVLLGTVSLKGLSSWEEELSSQREEYDRLKKTILPDINRVKVDPLLGQGQGQEDWTQYYKVNILSSLSFSLSLSCGLSLAFEE